MLCRNVNHDQARVWPALECNAYSTDTHMRCRQIGMMYVRTMYVEARSQNRIVSRAIPFGQVGSLDDMLCHVISCHAVACNYRSLIQAQSTSRSAACPPALFSHYATMLRHRQLVCTVHTTAHTLTRTGFPDFCPASNPINASLHQSSDLVI